MPRLFWACIALLPAAVLSIARWAVHPDPSGHGTHTQLGLPPCGFLTMTGLPCPGCGMTTAFAHTVRGELVAAAMANPMGLALALLSVAAIPVGLWGAVRGWPVFETLERLRIDRLLLGIAAGTLLTWVARLLGLWLGG